jgi:phosphatidylserine/phosphatidylglycerophosphate/cardiolipin synthase-like enzyme
MTIGSRLAVAIEAIFDAALRGADGRCAPAGVEETGRLADGVTEVLSRRGQAGLIEELQEGIAAAARRSDRVSLAVTGLGWLGGGVPAVERTVTDLLAGAQQEILLTAYSMTPGTGRVWEALETALATGIRCILIADRIDAQHPDIRAFLGELRRRYPRIFSVYDFCGADAADTLHAKIVVVDRLAAVVGSPNLTFHGMVSAHELAVVVRGPVAEQIAGRVDLLLRSPLVRPYPG